MTIQITDRKKGALRLPPWLRKSLSPGLDSFRTDTLVKDLGLETICESGRCPNRNECWSQKTATFMVMGERCTRNCLYCSVPNAKPLPLDPGEPGRLAEAVSRLGLRHVVVTCVTRDDLEDEGAAHMAACVRELKAKDPELILEILTSDFRRTQERAAALMAQQPIDIFNHNIETARRLHKKVRPQGGYDLSLELLRRMDKRGGAYVVKSGAMLGMGETREEVLEMMGDLRAAGCQMLTLGQYLQSYAAGLPVDRFVEPAEFEEYREIGYNMGFLLVESGPFVRSSYHAKDSFEKLRSMLGRKS